MKSLVLATLLLGTAIYAQEILPLPPETAVVAVPTEQTAIPQQSAQQLKDLSAPKAKLVPIATTGSAPATTVGTKVATPVAQETVAQPTELKTEEARLLALPSYNLQTNKAPLSDVLALLADACKMGYVGLEKGVGDDVQISVNISKNPYEILKYLCTRYNVALDYGDGVWHFGIYNDSGLIARVYHLRYNTQESVESSSSSSNSSSSNSDSTLATSSLASSSSSSNSSTFNVNRDVIVKDVEKFMDLSSDDPSVLTAPDFDVAAITEVKGRAVKRVLPASNKAGASADSKGKVLYNSDTHSLYVLASRAQHQWIEKYIASVDRPQKQILVEAKFYETGLSPEKDLGFQWSGSVGSAKISTGSAMKITGGMTAILTSDALSSTLNALSSNADTVSVQYPRQVTVSNRPVTLSAVEKVPVKQTSTTTSTSGDDQTQTEVEYIDVGTNISILPRVIDDNKVQMNINIKVSSIARYETIDTDEYPVVAEREYKTEAIVENGYTLAIGGLRGSSISDTSSEVPVISKIPLFGALFKQHSKSHSDTNLLIFISPSVLPEYRGGMSEDPSFVLPRDKDYPDRRAFTGSQEETYTDLMLSLNGMDHQIQTLAQRVHEGISVEAASNSALSLQNELKLMQVRLREIKMEQPDKDVSQATQKIEQYLGDLNELSRNISKQNSYL